MIAGADERLTVAKVYPVWDQISSDTCARTMAIVELKERNGLDGEDTKLEMTTISVRWINEFPKRKESGLGAAWERM